MSIFCIDASDEQEYEKSPNSCWLTACCAGERRQNQQRNWPEETLGKGKLDVLKRPSPYHSTAEFLKPLLLFFLA